MDKLIEIIKWILPLRQCTNCKVYHVKYETTWYFDSHTFDVVYLCGECYNKYWRISK